MNIINVNVYSEMQVECYFIVIHENTFSCHTLIRHVIFMIKKTSQGKVKSVNILLQNVLINCDEFLAVCVCELLGVVDFISLLFYSLLLFIYFNFTCL